MRPVTLVAILLIAAIALAVPAAAAKDAKAAKLPPMSREQFAAELKLPDSTKASVKTALTGYSAAAKAAAKAEGTPEQKKVKASELRTKAIADVKALLSTEQAVKAEKDKLVERLVAGAARPDVRMYLPQLGLSPEQKTKIDAILKDEDAKLAALRKDQSLTPETRRTKIAELRKEVRGKIDAVLTPEQQAKLKDLMGQKARGGKAKGAGAGRKAAKEPAATATPK
jgi:Spy/CpxP family protein refolding chaperone